jgi:hypothetical protein
MDNDRRRPTRSIATLERVVSIKPLRQKDILRIPADMHGPETVLRVISKEVGIIFVQFKPQIVHKNNPTV